MTENEEFALKNPASATASTIVDGCPPEVPINEYDQLRWFAMRSSYSRELKAQRLLQNDNFQCYVPTHRIRKEKGGRVIEQTVAVVHNLLFVHTTRRLLDPWKHLHEDDAALRYMIDKSTAQPMIVSDRAMNDFIRVTAEADDNVLFLDHPDVVLTRGQKVEVIAGQFRGIQGYILRIRRDRRVVVTLHGLVSVALATMPMEYFRILS